MRMYNARRLENKMDYLDVIFDRMVQILSDRYELVPSCNKDRSRYLIPKGTIKDLSYYGKPMHSFRVSDHWNWYASLDRCSDEHYVQCYTPDMPWTYTRIAEGKKSNVVYGASIAYYDDDGAYHVIAGEVFNRETKRWSWVALKEEDVENYLTVIMKGV